MKTSIYLPDEMAELARERGISLSEITQNALRGMMPENAFVSVSSPTDYHGIPGVDPVLQLNLPGLAGGLPDGASALFVINGSLQAESGQIADLGAAEPLLVQLSYGHADPLKLQLQPRWRISAPGAERLEQIRAGGSLTLEVGVRYGLMGGTAAPDWKQPHRPIRGPFPDQPTQVIIKAHDWVQKVLEPWQQATAVSLVIPLPLAGATDEHRTIVARLSEARRELDAGRWKPSIMATREAVDLLRRMRPTAISTKAQARDMAEREAAILDRVRELTQSLYDYESAAVHPDPHLRAIAWNRENAILALGTAASLAQLIFARP